MKIKKLSNLTWEKYNELTSVGSKGFPYVFLFKKEKNALRFVKLTAFLINKKNTVKDAGVKIKSALSKTVKKIAKTYEKVQEKAKRKRRHNRSSA